MSAADNKQIAEAALRALRSLEPLGTPQKKTAALGLMMALVQYDINILALRQTRGPEDEGDPG